MLTSPLYRRRDPDVFEWGVDPYFWTYVPMTLSSFLSYSQHRLYPEVLMTPDHRPIVKVAMMGYITGVEGRKNGQSILYDLDDGTGRVVAVHWKKDAEDKPAGPSYEGVIEEEVREVPFFPRGSLVHVRGKVSFYHHVREIAIHAISLVEDLNEETLWRLQILNRAGKCPSPGQQ